MRSYLTLILALVTPVFAWAVDWSGKGVSSVGGSYSVCGGVHVSAGPYCPQ